MPAFPLTAALFTAAMVFNAGAPSQTGASRFALAQVTDPRGKSIVDVGADDFVVQEGGAERDILDVRVADYPIAIVVDNCGATGEAFEAVRAAAARFVERIGVRPIAIVATSDPGRFAATFEDERPAVTEKLEGLEPAGGNGQLLAAMAAAGQAIRSGGALFSAIVVLTSSGPEASGTDVDALLAPIIDSRAVVHIVHNASVGTAPPLLRGIADQTHGGYTPIYAVASYQPALDALATRLTTELLIEYIVPAGSKAADVKIGVRIPGARVRGLGVAPR
jgi:hypothetical protein